MFFICWIENHPSLLIAHFEGDVLLQVVVVLVRLHVVDTPRAHNHVHAVGVMISFVICVSPVDGLVVGELLAGIHDVVDGTAAGAVHGAAWSGPLVLRHAGVQPIGSSIGQRAANVGGALLLGGDGFGVRRIALAVSGVYVGRHLVHERLLHEIVRRAVDNHLGHHVVQVVTGGARRGHLLDVGLSRLESLQHLRAGGSGRCRLTAQVERLLILQLLQLYQLGGIQYAEIKQLLCCGTLNGQVAAL